MLHVFILILVIWGSIALPVAILLGSMIAVGQSHDNTRSANPPVQNRPKGI